MSEIKVNKISPRAACGTTTLGDSGDTFNLPSGGTLTIASGATINNNGTANNFGATGAVNWNTTVKTSGFTAVNGEGYFVNTTGGAVSVNLPAGTAGAVVGIKDYANTFDTNAVTLVQNGSDKIGGSTTNASLETEGLAVTLVFIDSTRGWLVTDNGTQDTAPTTKYVTASGGTPTTSPCGDYKIHTFTGPGTFTVSCAGNAEGSNTVEYIVVAGGGGAPEADNNPGEYSYASGGGGAGGFRFASPSLAPLTYPAKPLAAPAGLAVPAAAYPIVVGGGGPKGQPGSSYGGSGSNSSFSTITSTGGGRGGTGGNSASPGPGSGGPGGSGGGAGARPISCYAVGTGNTPPVSPSQGFNGGEGTYNSFTAGGGGGGALAVGSNGVSPPTLGQGQGGNGGVGAGLPNGFGTSGQSNGGFYYFSGGAGGGANYNQAGGNGTNSSGGLGGGAGGKAGSADADSGTVNTGGGGGGTGGYNGAWDGGAGGSGIVIIRYKFQN